MSSRLSEQKTRTLDEYNERINAELRETQEAETRLKELKDFEASVCQA
jgi:hypothetical protein